MTPQEALRLAIRHHQAGELAPAEQIYRQIIQAAPQYADAWHLLGVLAHQCGQPAQAIEWISEAIRLNAKVADFHSNIAEAWRANGDGVAAEAAARRAIALDARHGSAFVHLGLALDAQGRVEEAIGAHRKAVSLKPESPQAWNNLGNALKQAGRLADALDALQTAVKLAPQLPASRYNLAETLRQAGDTAGALIQFETVLGQAPQLIEALKGRADCLSSLGRWEDAEAGYRQALALAPDHADSWCNLGLLLLEMGRRDEAIACQRQAVQHQPAHAAAWNNLGMGLRQNNRLAEAEAAHRRSLALQPKMAEALVNLGVVLKAQGKVAEAIAASRQALAIKPTLAQAESNALFDMHYLYPAPSADAFLQAHQDWAAHHGQTQPISRPKQEAGNRRLRIAYISPDLRAHPVGFLLAEVLPYHDRERYEVFCYADVGAPDSMTARLQAATEHWRTISGLNDVDVAKQVAEDGIDVLIDLAGHTAKQRLGVFARKPAPVAISWLGYCNTTGLPGMDFILTDPHSNPMTGPQRFSESVLYLPHSRFCYAPPAYAPAIGPRPERATVFGCFNNYAKLNDAVLDCWARILERCPDSRLILKTQELDDLDTRAACLQRLAQRGIAERTELRGYSYHADMLAEYADVDIALDPFPFTGGMTSLEALWMGVPLITLAGDSMVSRQGVSFLKVLGREAWIATDLDDYINRACQLAQDRVALTTLRSQLREQLAQSPLCDGQGFCQDLEHRLQSAWDTLQTAPR
ncbi:tetratricopeptide repeat protein [Parachitinimonas caeni]|uniref:protein O-GlcNAc transferase n=1 Tax=Parachitinimonas caeni TaxID=3031301 RepID=A0ABT7DXP4_9NEIS|nr:tetratricopeptide repeat protein [Parachitinimonas caeni]MDK2124837.1 tetratricopeptide repeat protein [Parachitinimonas caeni]